jgi:hypothetical protein
VEFAGSQILTVVPCPASDSTRMTPSCREIACNANDSRLTGSRCPKVEHHDGEDDGHYPV